MKKRFLAVCVMAALTMGMAGSVLADESETEIRETRNKETETADAAEVIIIKPEGREQLEVANTAELDIKAVSVEFDDKSGLAKITMASGDGTLYEFENVEYEDITEPELVKEGAFAKIKYIGKASGEERAAGQSGELIYEKPAELFAIDDVYIRSEPDSESEIVGIIYRGDAIEVQGETATHYLVKKDDVTGYTVRRCISEDEQEAIAAVQAENAAVRAAAAVQETAGSGYQSDGSGASSVYEVSRQRFDDCDGSGHGYYQITYSDGSTAIEEY